MNDDHPTDPDIPYLTQAEIDAAHRMADAVNLHVTAMKEEKRDRPGFIAIQFDTGKSPDGTLYDSRRDATRHTLNGPPCFYVKVGKATMSLREAIVVLQFNRQAYAKGVRFTEEHVETPHRLELVQRYIPRTLKGLEKLYEHRNRN